MINQKIFQGKILRPVVGNHKVIPGKVPLPVGWADLPVWPVYLVRREVKFPGAFLFRQVFPALLCLFCCLCTWLVVLEKQINACHAGSSMMAVSHAFDLRHFIITSPFGDLML